MLCDRHSRGDVLVTVATGELSDAEAERTGLVPTHAYAVLNVRVVMNKRLFLLLIVLLGIFWIDIDFALRAFFDVFYLNWNPSLFKYTYCTHE